eukprot:Nitzschia sp. Nitz4//scaffold14_size191712//178624//180891//NITZ4_001753-RA/size191712-processed-gene-0.83-mRNA-1//-1//CDS//3329537017//401//frame0
MFGFGSKRNKEQSKQSSRTKAKNQTKTVPIREITTTSSSQTLQRAKSQSSLTEREDVATSSNQKQKGFFGRFKKNQELQTETELAREAVQERNQRKATTTDATSTKSLAQNRQDSSTEIPVEDLDPISLFFEAAGQLDPFGFENEDYDSDSEDSTDSSNTGPSRLQPNGVSGKSTDVDHLSRKVTRGDNQASKSNSSVSSSPTVQPDPPAVTEIRLNFQAIPEDSVVEQQSTCLNSVQGDAPEVEEAREPEASNEVSSHTRSTVSSYFQDTGIAPQASGLKKLVCCAAPRINSRGVIHLLDSDEARDVFPAARLIADNNTRNDAVHGDGTDYVNGVMGVPSDRFLQAKGPQSLYEYEYSMNQQVDVYYEEFGRDPRNTIKVRQLGAAPVLDNTTQGESAVVQIEASTISETDCILRRGDWWGQNALPEGITPGVGYVGKIIQLKQQKSQVNFKPKDTILALTKWGGNSRYQTVSTNDIVKVPDGVDPAEAACLTEMYLSAFQVLHYGQVGAARYTQSSLRGKSILIVGSMSNNMGVSMIELALHAGVANIYATAKKKHWKTLISFGIMPLSQEPTEWIARIEGTIDLVLAPNGGYREDVTPIHYRALKPKEGRLILSGRRMGGDDVQVGDWEQRPQTLVCAKNKEMLKRLNRSHMYDVFEQWDNCKSMCKKDLEHLLGLLKDGHIQPRILDRVPLYKVSRAHELLDTKRLSGFLVCEPWMKRKKRAVYL